MIGVLDLKVLEQGIPDEAFDPVTGDDKQVARSLKKQNRSERQGQRVLAFDTKKEISNLIDEYRALSEIRDDSPEQVRRKAEAFQKIQSHGSKWWHDQTACHLWTSAFFAELTYENNKNNRIATTETLRRYLETHAIDGRQIGNAWALAQKHRFFHWPLEFPEVFSPLVIHDSPPNIDHSPFATHHSLLFDSGFDVILCNPPWERIKLQEQEFFASKDPEIANAPNKSARQRLIQRLPESNPALWNEYQQALYDADAQSKYLRHSERFGLTARGDINTYSVFAELFTNLINPKGRVGVVIPTGIATDDTNKFFFAYLVDSNGLVSLYDFENREKLFPTVDSRYKFSLLTIRGTKDSHNEPAKFAFFLTNVNQLRDEQRIFTLSADDFNRLNPNTKTCPVFRTRADAELTKNIYYRVPSLSNNNMWSLKQAIMFHSMHHASLFRSKEKLEEAGFKLEGNVFKNKQKIYLPLYEGKSFIQYDHRFANVIYTNNPKRPAQPILASLKEHMDPNFISIPREWIDEIEVESWHKNMGHKKRWLIVYKKITSGTNERTILASILPNAAFIDTIHLLVLDLNHNTRDAACLLGNINSMVFDYIIRQKLGGTAINFYIFSQLPLLGTSIYKECKKKTIVCIVIELVYTSWDIKTFADDLWRDADEGLRGIIRKQWEENRTATGGHEWNPPEWAEIAEDGIPLPPFKWDENRRAILRAELDAYYAKLYGLTRKELRYILDPADLTEKELEDILDPWEEVEDPLDPEGYAKRVERSTFPGETFRVLKEKEIRQFGEYRTRRIVLEAWNKLEAN